jgi:uncharacterized protein
MPERMCIVTREVKDEAALIRFVRSPAGDVVPDLARKLPGRGVWVSAERGILVQAVKKGLFSRGFSAESRVEGDLPERLSGLLRQQVVSTLSLARKAGVALAGFMKVEELAKKERVRLLFHAANSGTDGQRKLDRLMRPGTVVCAFLQSADLDLAFGRANVVHAAVAAGGLADKLVTCVGRLAAYDGLTFRTVGSEDEI